MSTRDNPWQSITLEELAKHNDLEKNDAWMSVKGVVYDVSSYAVRHPGGAEKIRKYAGKDATDVFNMVHPYVNADAILHEYQVGILKGHPGAPKRTLITKLKGKDCCCIGGHYKPPTTNFKQDSIVGTYIVEFQNSSRSAQESDWTVGVKDKQYLQVFKYIDKWKAWFSSYELPEALSNESLTLEFKHGFDNVEITLRKPIAATIWAKQAHGLKEAGRFVGIQEEQAKYDAYILTKKCLTQNVLLFGIQICSSARIGVPIGFHVRLYHQGLSRPYTAVCQTISDDNELKYKKSSKDGTVLYFMIKIYPNGLFTRMLDEIELDDGREIPTLQVSTPHGYFDADFLNEFAMLLLIGGGTGLTPFIRIIHRFTTMINKIGAKQVVLLFFCEKEHDLIWKNQFNDLQNNTSWFNYLPVLTKPNENWQGLKGRISDDLVKNCVSKLHVDKRGAKKACICGPPGFNSAAVDSLSGTVLMENIFVFSN